MNTRPPLELPPPPPALRKTVAYSEKAELANGARSMTLAEVTSFVTQRFEQPKADRILALLKLYNEKYPNGSSAWTEGKVLNALKSYLDISSKAGLTDIKFADLQAFQDLDKKFNSEIVDILNAPKLFLAIDRNEGGSGTLADGAHGNQVAEAARQVYEKQGFKIAVVPPVLEDNLNDPEAKMDGIDVVNSFEKMTAWVEARSRETGPKRETVVSISLMPKWADREVAVNSEAFKKEFGINLTSISPNQLSDKDRIDLMKGVIARLPAEQKPGMVRFMQSILRLIKDPGVVSIKYAAGNKGEGYVDPMTLIFGKEAKFFSVGTVPTQSDVRKDLIKKSSLSEVYAESRVLDGKPQDYAPYIGQEFEKVKTCDEKLRLLDSKVFLAAAKINIQKIDALTEILHDKLAGPVDLTKFSFPHSWSPQEKKLNNLDKDGLQKLIAQQKFQLVEKFKKNHPGITYEALKAKLENLSTSQVMRDEMNKPDLGLKYIMLKEKELYKYSNLMDILLKNRNYAITHDLVTVHELGFDRVGELDQGLYYQVEDGILKTKYPSVSGHSSFAAPFFDEKVPLGTKPSSWILEAEKVLADSLKNLRK